MKLEELDLIDLVSERHQQLRKVSGELWNKNSDLYISNSEWFILTRIFQEGQTTSSYITKSVDISRQGTHKFLKQLESKGLVRISKMKENKRERLLELTSLGEECVEKNQLLKRQIEQEISEAIGEEQIIQLKKILTSEWNL
ncbi:MarR family winged helix-turn-helix transcriptional regulator [Aquisalibacillus elongatus]|uniref:DNA-binding MarR family transcriptional regulator n=1 Tax=Aquisalibacillus elongatus TaxID=485577 RepID=A0A3N5AYT4_9BACI|nr:MarR family transcriptional regulator [Aquisalibacillus elongatus]RPF50093.1 DNA-binding MarR family transcriptional regulator [Aquisalibacillus elongatus]